MILLTLEKSSQKMEEDRKVLGKSGSVLQMAVPPPVAQRPAIFLRAEQMCWRRSRTFAALHWWILIQTPAGLSSRLPVTSSALGRLETLRDFCCLCCSVCFFCWQHQPVICLSACLPACVLGSIQKTATVCLDGQTQDQYLLTGHHWGLSFFVLFFI